jgi:hypothetical protein
MATRKFKHLRRERPFKITYWKSVRLHPDIHRAVKQEAREQETDVSLLINAHLSNRYAPNLSRTLYNFIKGEQ